MYRQARERIIALELMKLERRQAIERGRRTAQERPQPTGARRPQGSRPSMRPGRFE
jgi:hypothetical protein